MTDDDLPTADEVRGILKADIAERMRGHAKADHAKGCQGREYYCRCGYDEKTGPLLFDAADEIERLRTGIKNAITDIIEDDAKSQNILRKLKALLDEQVAQ